MTAESWGLLQHDAACCCPVQREESGHAERRGTPLYKAPPPPPALSVSTHLIFSKLRDLFCDAVISPVLFLLV